MSVQVYILIQTEVGKASGVAKAVSAIAGVTLAEGVTGPVRCNHARRVTKYGRTRSRDFGKGSGSARNYPHPNLPSYFLLKTI